MPAIMPPTIVTGDWDDGSEAAFEPWADGYAVGFKCIVNGRTSYIYLNPSSGGASPDVFVYQSRPGEDPEDAEPVCFLAFAPPDNTPDHEEP